MRLVPAFVALIALPLLAIPARADIEIAMVAPMTGTDASAGEQMRDGSLQAVEDLNAKGGVLGQKLRLTIHDDVCDPKQAVAVANHIVGDQVKFVDGHACSGSSIPASDVYADNKVLMISPASSNPALTEKGLPTILRVFPRDDAQGAFIAPWIANKYKDEKIAVVHDKSAYGQGLATVVRNKLHDAGAKEVLFEGINAGEKDYSAIVSKLRSLGVEVLYFGGYHTELGLIKRQAGDLGYKLQAISGDGLATPEFWSIAGPAGEGTLFTFASDPRRSPGAAKALAYFKAQNFEPEGFTLFSYAVIETIAAGVQRAGSDDAVKVAAALKTGQPVDTILGPIKFDAKGDVVDPGFDINIWHDGKYAALPK